jgi:glucose/arabinose dehydrogenase
MRNLIISVVLLFTLLSTTCKENGSSSGSNDAQVSADIEIKIAASGLENVWEIAWAPDNKLWFTQRDGKVSKLDPATGQVKDIIEISEVEARGEGGLLGMALHPDFNSIPEVFLVYNYESSNGYREKVVKYTFNGTTLINPRILMDNIAGANFHDGSRLVISDDLKLFITTGDATNSSNSQNLASVNGKILRINLDGTIPSDNPNPQSSIWSFGHRNAQGLVFAKGKLYSSEHGPNNDDEINLIEKGRNYGWPDVEGKCNTSDEREFCAANNVVEPIYSWTPTIAVCGIKFYNSDLISQWKNSLLLCTLKESTLFQLKLNSSGDAIESVDEIIPGTYGRLRAICVAPDGKVFIGTSNGNDDKIVSINKK